MLFKILPATMATRTVEHEIDLATVIETEILSTYSNYDDCTGINLIIALLKRFGINYSIEELNWALNKLLHEKKIEFAMGTNDLIKLMADEKKESPKIALYFKSITPL